MIVFELYRYLTGYAVFPFGSARACLANIPVLNGRLLGKLCAFGDMMRRSSSSYSSVTM